MSAATASLTFVLDANSTMTPAQVTTFNASTSPFNVGVLPNATCPANGSDFTCTVTASLPAGTDTITVTAYDAAGGTGNVLSQQIATVTVVNGQQNVFTLSLDANPATISVGGLGYCSAMSVANNATVVAAGATPLAFNVGYTDAASKTVTGPGLPKLAVNGRTDDNGGAGYTLPGTGGTVNVKVSQLSQSFTLTASTGAVTAPITVTATPPGADGLAFGKSLSFSLQSVPAPPASLLADIEQRFNGLGLLVDSRIELWALTLGTTDTFAAVPPGTLSYTNHQVDFPTDLLFDANGDLLIANNGAGMGGGPPEPGNFACVPAPAIASGASTSTALTTNVDHPQSIALGADNSVAIANNASHYSPYALAEFTLAGTYTPAPATRDLPLAPYGSGSVRQVVALSASAQNPAGTFAIAITDGTNAGTHIVLKRPDGSTAQLPTSGDPHVNNPSMAYDPRNDQLVLADGKAPPSYLTFWDAATLTKIKDVLIDDGSSNDLGVASAVAASPDGHIAVAVHHVSNDVNVYDNVSSSRALVSAPIPFGATTTQHGSDYCFGGTLDNVGGLRWLTSSKLLVALVSANTNVATGSNGLYVFDISQPPANDQCGSGGTLYDYFGNVTRPWPKQTGFQALTYLPVTAAYRP